VQCTVKWKKEYAFQRALELKWNRSSQQKKILENEKLCKNIEMDQARKQELERDLREVVASLNELERMRRIILEAMSSGTLTSARETQHEKLAALDRRIRTNMRYKQDLEAVLASDFGVLL
jgi:chaperonin cofactor prefoldin